jgi:predicted  nucleic acid-binding Zn ribbon protein
MFTFDLIVNLTKLSFDDIQYEVENLLIYLGCNSQIIKQNHQYILEDNQLRMPVICPEVNSLAIRYSHRFTLHCLEQLQIKTQTPLDIRPTGRAADRLAYQVPVDSSSYIIYGNGFSPVLCGDTYQPIPLYLFPPLNPETNSYQDLNRWHYAYQSLVDLWSVYDYGERFALRQLQQVGSPFVQQGRSLCQRIEQLTGKPTYYFLDNRRNRSETQDRAHKCPLTGKEWLIKGSTFNDFIGFKCEESRLVSELSSMVRTSPVRPKNTR